MKTSPVTNPVYRLIFFVFFCVTALGQGFINFNNSPSATAPSLARVFGVDGTTPVSGSNCVAQLYAGLTSVTLDPAGAAVTFGTGVGSGFFDQSLDLERMVPFAPGTQIVVGVRAWSPRSGSTYEEASTRVGGLAGSSPDLNIKTGEVGAPTPMSGLQGFAIGYLGDPFDGKFLFDTYQNGRGVPLTDPNTCEPFSGGTFVGQVYGDYDGTYYPLGTPVSFGTGPTAGYLQGGVVTMNSILPGLILHCVIRIWESRFVSWEMAELRGQTHDMSVQLGGATWGGTVVPMGQVYVSSWPSCTNRIQLSVSTVASLTRIFWNLEGFLDGEVPVPQEADSPTGPWKDLEGPWHVPGKPRLFPPNTIVLPANKVSMYYRMRVASRLEP